MDYKVTDTELTAVADAIRIKGGTSEPLEWNADFISAINAIPSEGGRKELLYEINESQGGFWIDTEINISDINTLLFENIRDGTMSGKVTFDVSNIVLSNGADGNHTVILTQNATLNAFVGISNQHLFVSYDNAGSSSNVVKIYDYAKPSDSFPNVLSGADEPSDDMGSNGDIYLCLYNVAQITDVSGFTKLYNSALKYGSYGAKVSTLLDITDESSHTNLMSNGWNTSGAAYYDAENLLGAYGGYDFGGAINIGRVKLWLGRYSSQNKTLTATLEYKDNQGNWNEVCDLSVAKAIDYPVNVFVVDTYIHDAYGIRWIHKKEPTKSTSNNITFFGMTIYEISNGSVVQSTYAKVSDAWQNLIGTNINNINTGNNDIYTDNETLY